MFTHQLMILWAVFTLLRLCRSAIMFSCSVVSDSLQPNGLQHTRLPCPSLSPGVCSNSCPLSQKCHPTTSSSVTTFYSCPPSFQASGSFPVSWPFASGDQSFGVSASASVLSLNIQGCFPLGLTDLISLLSKWKWKALNRVWLFATPWTVCSLPCSSVHGILKAKVLKVGSHSLFEEIFSTQGLNPSLWHCRQILNRLSHQGSPAVQGILKSLLKHHNLKASILQCSALFIVQL